MYAVSTQSNLIEVLWSIDTHIEFYSLSATFFIGALPVQLYREKNLKTPIILCFSWLIIGIFLFIYNFNRYPVNLISGGLFFPPQPGYIFRPWMPLILMTLAWKLEEAYKHNNNQENEETTKQASEESGGTEDDSEEEEE